MKNKHQIIKVLLLITIYCFGSYLSTDALSYFKKENILQNNNQTEYLSTKSKVLFVHTQQYESSVYNLTEYSLPDFESSNNLFWLNSNSNQLLVDSKFKQYKNHLKTLLIRQRKSDLIFPFHNFW